MQQNNKNREPVGYLALIRSNPNFRFLWTGQVVSLLGDWFNLIASAALISHLTHSGLAIGSLFVVRMIAPFLVSPLAGVLADRYNRKTLLIVADILRGIIVLGFLTIRNAEQAWLLYVFTAIQLAFSGIFFPARNAIIPNIVSRTELGAANAISTTTWSVMLSFGAAIGGLVAGQWGIYPAFVVDSLSFFLSAFLISRIHYKHEVDLADGPTDAWGQIVGAFRQYIEGLKYLKDHTDVFAITLNKPTVSLLASGAFQVIQVILAQQVFIIGENGSTGLGMMFAFAGLGAGIGPIVARIFTGDRDRPLRNAITISYVLSVFGLAVTAPLASLPLVLFGIFVRMLGGGINWTFSTQLLLEWVPDKVRGRIFSSEFAMLTLANAISSATSGWLLDNTELGIGGIMWWMAGLMIVPGILWHIWTNFRKSSTQAVKMEKQLD